jgi:hypothetical protein
LSTCPFPNIIATFVDIVLHLIGSPLAILHSLEGVVGPGFMGASHKLTWSSPISMPFGAYYHTPHGPKRNFEQKKKRNQPLGRQLKIAIKANFGLSCILGSIVPSLVI